MKDKGLTLIEVLVVITIIALLSTIAIPVMQKSKDQGKGLLCANNLRQLGLAMSVYAQEKTTYPEGFCGDPICHPSIDSEEYEKLGTKSNLDWQNSWWWFHFLTGMIEEDYSKDGILACPSKRLTAPDLSTNILCGNYGVNYAICKTTAFSTNDDFFGRPLRPDQVKSPSSKLLLMDSGYTLISWEVFMPEASVEMSAFGLEMPKRQNSYFLPGATINQSRFENGSIDEIQRNEALNGRHSSGKFNVAFADGHVDKKSPDAVEPAFDTDGNISNRSFWSP